MSKPIRIQEVYYEGEGPFTVPLETANVVGQHLETVFGKLACPIVVLPPTPVRLYEAQNPLGTNIAFGENNHALLLTGRVIDQVPGTEDSRLVVKGHSKRRRDEKFELITRTLVTVESEVIDPESWATSYRAIHETGHAHELTHCQNVCIMEPSERIGVEAQAFIAIGDGGFCDSCTQSLEDFQP